MSVPYSVLMVLKAIASPLWVTVRPVSQEAGSRTARQQIGNVVANNIPMTTVEREKHSSQGICGCHYHQMSDWFTLQIVWREIRRSRRMADHLL
jgi:hypothetical protein